MKISIAISVLILISAAFLGYADHSRLEAVRRTHAKLVADASSLGISVDKEGSADGLLVTKRAREDRDAQARQTAKEMIAFAKEMEAFKESGGKPDEAMQKRITELMDTMLSLDSNQIKILIAEFRASTEIEEETRTGMIVFAIMSLANDHPQAALSIFTESEDLMENGMMSKHLLSSSLANWASQDPDAALEWVRENGKKHPDLITDDVKAGLVKGAAINDMKLGFDLIAELGLENPNNALSGIARGLKTPEERTQFLSLLRKFSEGQTDKSKASGVNAINALADGIVKDGFEAGSKWIGENKLTQEEMVGMASTIGYSATGSDKGKWISWMGENLNSEQGKSRIQNTVRNWTDQDYRAAGEWLAAEPNGPAKIPAVKGYVAAVAKVDPQTATQWALTLPEGKDRMDTLRGIHDNWPKDTPEQKAARDAFAKEYGMAK